MGLLTLAAQWQAFEGDMAATYQPDRFETARRHLILTAESELSYLRTEMFANYIALDPSRSASVTAERDWVADVLSSIDDIEELKGVNQRAPAVGAPMRSGQESIQSAIDWVLSEDAMSPRNRELASRTWRFFSMAIAATALPGALALQFDADNCRATGVVDA